VTHSNAAGSQARLSFVGTGFRWIGALNSDGGIGQISLDGYPVAHADQFAQAYQPAAVSFEMNGLAYGPHTMLIQVTGSKNPQSTDFRVYVDAIDVFGTTTLRK
jgi:hypothetical protein